MSPSKGKSSTHEIPKELRREFAEGRVVLFIGAGVSMAVDTPGWEELIQPLSENNLEIRLLKRLSLEQRVSFFLRREGGRQDLRQIFRKELEQSRDLTVHKALISLPVSLILTTNYDPNLEKAANELGRSCEVIRADRQVPENFGTKDLTIIHLYGDTEEFLASEEDLVNFERDRPVFSSILQHVLLTRTVFFLGFSFRDYNVLNHILRSHAMLRVEGPMNYIRPHYAHMVDSDTSVLPEIWKRRGLQIFVSKPGKTRRQTSQSFLEFVHRLVQEVAELSYEDPREREEMICRVESNYYYNCSEERKEKLLMRREATFSVLAFPEIFEESGLGKSREGYDLGIKRKRIYEKWMRAGTLKLLLNCQPHYWKLRGYTPPVALQRLRAIRTVVEEQLNNEGFVLGIRRHPKARDSFASLGDSLLLHSNSPSSVKKSDIIRDRHAVNVFNLCFDREMEDLMCDAGASFEADPGPNEIHQLKVFSLATLNRLIEDLERG